MIKFKVRYWNKINKKMFKEYIERYKDRQKDYITVYIFDKYEEMYDKVDKIEEEPQKRDYIARAYSTNYNYYSTKDNEYIKTGNMCGWICLCDEKNSLAFQEIAHEVSHSVIGYFSRKLENESDKIIKRIGMRGKDVDEEALEEELYCYMVGNMCNEIIYQYNKRL